VAIYLAIANRQLINRSRQLEKALEQQRAASTPPIDLFETRHIPSRLPPLNLPQPRTSETAAEIRPPVTEPVEVAPEADRPQNPELGGSINIPGTLVVADATRLLPVAVAAPEWVRYAGREGSRCVVEGTSNIHDWQMESRIIAGQISIAAELDFDHPAAIAQFPTNLPCSAAAVIPLRSLKSDSRKMDEGMQNALEIEAFPTIKFQLRSLFFKEAATNAPAAILFESMGDLTIHGVTRQVEIPVVIAAQPNERLSVTGSVNVRMTDFSIKPPQAALGMGLIKTGDDLKIEFDWQVERVPRSEPRSRADGQ
jgi:hypothetical protein